MTQLNKSKIRRLKWILTKLRGYNLHFNYILMPILPCYLEKSSVYYTLTVLHRFTHIIKKQQI